MVTGASGLIGQALLAHLREKGHQVFPAIRTTKPIEGEVIRWDPERGFIDYRDLEGVEVFINLAGESIADGRWTSEKKERIRRSRVESTNFLAQIAASLEKKPRLFINASAIGFYGSQGDSILTESSPQGSGFLAEVCQEWEEATHYARREGIRTCQIRFGMVLSPKGGALPKMLPPFRMGLGGKMGNGKQWWSWIALEDAVRAIQHVIDQPDLEGPINVVSPFPVTNSEFTQTLGHILQRPTFLPFPAPFARIAFGEMADELLLASQRALPDKLLKTGFSFTLPKLDVALQALLS